MTDLLFNDRTFSDFIANHQAGLSKCVRRVRLDADHDDLDSIVDGLAEKFKLDVPEVDTRGTTGDISEMETDDGYIIRVTLHVPIKGDSDLMHIQPSVFSFSPPRGSVSGNELLMNIDVPVAKVDADRLKDLIGGAIGTIQTYLDNLRRDCRIWNEGLRELVTLMLKQRPRFDKEQLLEAIGLKPTHWAEIWGNAHESRKTDTPAA